MIDAVRIISDTFVARVEHYPALDSTNSRAAECAARGVKELPLLVVADEQTAGRGRGVNRWWTGPGSLAFSLLVDAETVAADRGRSPLVALATGAAVVETVALLLPGRNLGLKWPNDVTADGRKLAGILIEALADRRHIIGVGLNTNNTLADAPAELRTTAGTICDMSGQTHDQTDVLVDLLNCLKSAFADLRDEPEKIVARANELCPLRGREVSLTVDGSTVEGRCRGIAPDGALLIDTPDGDGPPKAFYSGTLAMVAAASGSDSGSASS